MLVPPLLLPGNFHSRDFKAAMEQGHKTSSHDLIYPSSSQTHPGIPMASFSSTVCAFRACRSLSLRFSPPSPSPSPSSSRRRCFSFARPSAIVEPSLCSARFSRSFVPPLPSHLLTSFISSFDDRSVSISIIDRPTLCPSVHPRSFSRVSSVNFDIARLRGRCRSGHCWLSRRSRRRRIRPSNRYAEVDAPGLQH